MWRARPWKMARASLLPALCSPSNNMCSSTWELSNLVSGFSWDKTRFFLRFSETRQYTDKIDYLIVPGHWLLNWPPASLLTLEEGLESQVSSPHPQPGSLKDMNLINITRDMFSPLSSSRISRSYPQKLGQTNLSFLIIYHSIIVTAEKSKFQQRLEGGEGNRPSGTART